MGDIDSDSAPPFSLPRITLEDELGGGHQGQVWRGRRGDQELVLKAVDARHHTRDDVARRVQLVRRLCGLTTLPPAPVRMGQEWVVEVDLPHGEHGLVTAHELLEGDEPSLTDPSDVTASGSWTASSASTSPAPRERRREPPAVGPPGSNRGAPRASSFSTAAA